MHVTAQQPAQMASTGQGRRRMQGPPTTLAYELIHPMEATPRGALSLVRHRPVWHTTGPVWHTTSREPGMPPP